MAFPKNVNPSLAKRGLDGLPPRYSRPMTMVFFGVGSVIPRAVASACADLSTSGRRFPSSWVEITLAFSARRAGVEPVNLSMMLEITSPSPLAPASIFDGNLAMSFMR